MGEFVDFDLTFTDNSTGTRDEDGTEVQIYTDSPGFVPNIVADHANAFHPWMSLPLIGAGITTIPVRLEAPLTFVKVRVRQFNANGNGPWNMPGGGAGETFTFPALTAVGAPDAPSNVGLAIVGTPTPPVTPPTTTPPVGGGGGTSTTYSIPSQFSGTQGASGWSYKDSSGANLTYDTASAVWRHASQAYLSIWSGGMHPGPSLGSQYSWLVPNSGTATVTGSVNLYTTPGSGKGVTYVVKHNATTKFTQSMTDTTVYQLADQITSSFSVTAGDTLTFTLTSNQADNSNTSTQTSINIALSSGGAPTNPVVANISPATLSAYPGTTSAVTVNLSGPAVSNATVTLSTTNAGIASVPASIVVPVGQSSGLFDITGVALGSATVSAAYNSTSASCAVSIVSIPTGGGGQWPNEPAGMTLVTDTPFSDSLGPEWVNVYNTQSYASPSLGGQSFSPPRSFVTFREAGSFFGNGQWELNFPNSHEVYVGTYWGTSAGFQGYSNNTNKMFFVRDGNADNSFFVWQGLQDAPKTLKWYQQGHYNNTHIPTVFNTNYPTDGTGWFENNVNASAAVYTAGQPMRFIELYLKSSTTSSSRDGIIRWWVNGTLCGSYTNANISPNGFNNFVLNHTWDGSVDPTIDLSRSWYHYWDHMHVSRR